MSLLIRAVRQGGPGLAGSICAAFGAAGGTLGRGDDCTLALPDPRRCISRLQAEVLPIEDGYMLRSLGRANPLRLNGQMLAPGRCVRLLDGDELQVGDYLLQVRLLPAGSTAIS